VLYPVLSYKNALSTFTFFVSIGIILCSKMERIVIILIGTSIIFFELIILIEHRQLRFWFGHFYAQIESVFQVSQYPYLVSNISGNFGKKGHKPSIKIHKGISIKDLEW
jgi:hypothetical protein